MKNKKPVIVIAVLIAIITTLMSVKFGKKFSYAGTLEATQVDVPARVSSVVESREIRDGDTVKAGQPLYRLAGEDIRVAAEAAQSDYARAERLFKMGSMPQETFEHLKSRKDDTALRFKWCTIEAPSDGTILSTYREKGEWVAPGMKMLTMANLKELRAVFYVEQPRLATLTLGQTVSGFLPEMPARIFEGKLTRIHDEAEFTPKNVQTREERTRLVYGIQVTFPNPDGILKSGMTMETRFSQFP